jgi:hypothetical protein
LKRINKIFLFIIFILLVAEISCRLIWGLGNPVLFIEDKDYEYIYKPNQNVKRFGSRIFVNEYSMRSKPIKLTDSTIVILKLGDSIINGGTLTDQDSLASTILENKLRKQFNYDIRILNISAGSWGPDNAFQYIKRHGNFNSKFFVLVFSSHDLYDLMHFEKVVDSNPSWPSNNPPFALYEVVERYLIPAIKIKMGLNAPPQKIKNKNGTFSYTDDTINPGWQQFIDYTKKNNIKLVVLLHPTVYETIEKKYDSYGQRLIELFDSAKVDYKLELTSGIDTSLYRDDIHYNDKGQKKMVDELYPYMNEYVRKEIELRKN